MNTTSQELTNEQFQDIYTSEKFRNEVATAHKCMAKESKFSHFESCSYPIRYKVTEEQINEAKRVKEESKKKAIKNVANKLVFVAMGGDYEPRYNDDVCNHRIRTTFLNPEGKKFFIEFGRGREDEIRIDHSIDRDLQNYYEKQSSNVRDEINRNGGFHKVAQSDPLMLDYKKYQGQPYQNYKGLERINLTEKYTLQNLLKLVNENFECNFKEIEVDKFNLSPDDFTCKSPKK